MRPVLTLTLLAPVAFAQATAPVPSAIGALQDLGVWLTAAPAEATAPLESRWRVPVRFTDGTAGQFVLVTRAAGQEQPISFLEIIYRAPAFDASAQYQWGFAFGNLVARCLGATPGQSIDLARWMLTLGDYSRPDGPFEARTIVGHLEVLLRVTPLSSTPEFGYSLSAASRETPAGEAGCRL